MTLRYFRHFSGKPNGTLTITQAQGWRPLDATTQRGTLTGHYEHMLYANIQPIFRSGQSMGVVRVRYVRDDGDTTAFQDYTIHRDQLIGGRFLIQPVHFEHAARQGGRWNLRCGGGIDRITLHTRYAKIAVIGT